MKFKNYPIDKMENNIQNPQILKKILWIDAISAVFSAIAVLVFLSEIANLVSLPPVLLISMSLLSFCYVSFALYLLFQKPVSKSSLKTFIYANWGWVFGCLLATLFLFSQTNKLGISYLLWV
jgi:hypothetical protein